MMRRSRKLQHMASTYLSCYCCCDETCSCTQIELVPGGRSRPVTGNNRLEYIHRVAHFMLNAQSKRTAEAFRAGLEKVIPEEWLRMFNEQELQVHFHLTSHQDIPPQQ